MKHSLISLIHIVSQGTLAYSHGLASLGACLLNSGEYDVVLHILDNKNVGEVTEEIIAQEPCAVLVSSTTAHWAIACTLAGNIKAINETIPVLIGGAHVTGTNGIIGDNCFDIIVTGEAENGICSLIKKIISRQSLKANKITQQLLSLSPPTSLDLLPLPRIDLFPKEVVKAYPSVMFSRGCPLSCSYCMSRLGGYANHIRWKSPERAVKEVRSLLQYVSVNEIYIDDDTFTKNLQWLANFVALYRSTVNIPFYCNAHPKYITDKSLMLLREAGCVGIGIGIESGSQQLRFGILDRPVTDEEIIIAFQKVHRMGLSTWSFNMIGLPGETEEDLQATIELNQKVDPDWIRISFYHAYPGTPLQASQSLDPSYQPYGLIPKTFNASMINLSQDWITSLHRQSKLWHTPSEIKVLLFNLKKDTL